MLEIRRAQAADAQMLLDFLRVVGSESDNLSFGAEGVSFTAEQEAAFLESLLHSDKNLMLVAVEDGEILGNASLSAFSKPRLSHRGEISVAVKKSAWGRGLGSRLMAEAISFARQIARLEILTLEVRSDNARAIALYQKFGFEKTGAFPGFMKIGGRMIDFDLMLLRL